MASIKQVAERKYKITISNGYRMTDVKSARRKRFRCQILYQSAVSSSMSTTKPSDWNACSSRVTVRMAR